MALDDTQIEPRIEPRIEDYLPSVAWDNSSFTNGPLHPFELPAQVGESVLKSKRFTGNT